MEIQKKCAVCGKMFVAHKMTSLYCSRSCNRAAMRNRKREKTENKETNEIGSFVKPKVLNKSIRTKDFLTPADLSKMFGVSQRTVYRYIVKGIFKFVRIGNNSFIRKSDIDALFNDPIPYKKRTYTRKKETQYYTMKEITEKFKIGRKAVWARCDRFGIPKVYEGRNTFFSKAAVDVHFAELIEEIDLENYYTIKQIMDKFNMSHDNVLNFVCRNKIPRINRGRNAYYSKVHVDNIKVKGEDIDVNWYTYSEIMEKYKLTKDQIVYYIRQDGVKTEKRGKFTMISRADFDKKVIRVRFAGVEKDTETGEISFISRNRKPTVQKQPSAPPETPEGYYSVEDISTNYKLRPKRVWEITRENNIPKIVLKHFNFYERKAIDDLFAEFNKVEGVTEWITAEQIESQYSMSPDSRRSFIHRHKIPSKVEYGEIFYSKGHIDQIKQGNFEGRENFYSVPEAMEKYNLTKDCVHYYCKSRKIVKKKFGQMAYIPKIEFDKVMQEKSLSDKHLPVSTN